MISGLEDTEKFVQMEAAAEMEKAELAVAAEVVDEVAKAVTAIIDEVAVESTEVEVEAEKIENEIKDLPVEQSEPEFVPEVETAPLHGV